MWELTVPVSQIYCKQIKETYCPTVPAIANAVVVGGQTEPLPANATVRYECLDGYKHLGSDPELMCTDNGTWTFQFFECLKIDCGRPEPVTNAIITINNGTGFAAKAEYTCHRGHYHASNQWTRTCGPDGHWTREFIECVPYGVEHCGDPPPVMVASVEIYSAQLTGLAIYTCTEGYVNFWTNSYECSETFKSWSSGPDIRCRPVDCGDPPVLDHSQALYNETHFGSQVVYQCHAGYKISPNGNTKTCASNGIWTSEPLVECILLETTTCGAPPNIPNSVRTYQSTVQGSFALYTCDQGFAGQRFNASCGADGRWERGHIRSCSPGHCGAVPSVENSTAARVSGTTYGHVVAYQCLAGYTHTGPSLKTCEANQHWSSDIVECVPKGSLFCGNPPRIDHTSFTYGSRAVGAEAIYSCAAGYIGSTAVSVCDVSGQWADPGITCEPVNCLSPPSMLHAQIVPSRATVGPNRFGLLINFVCEVGYVPTPGYPLSSICQADGSWSSVNGHCQESSTISSIMCTDSPPTVLNAEILSKTGTYVGSVVRYTCRAGYYPFPPRETFFHTCMPNQIWSKEFLQCVPSLCIHDPPPSVINAELVSLEKKDWTDENTVMGVYSCSKGYTTDGKSPKPDSTNTAPPGVPCDLFDGWNTWAAALQGCQPVNCGEIKYPHRVEGLVVSTSLTALWLQN